MKAESEVAIFFALSIFSNEKFKADDDRLNYQSYKELGLICGQCRELIFFKQGIERVSHFSHFRDTGKDCPWRTESHSNTQSSDSFKREQSLQEFQTKFRWIIEQGIIKHQQISDSQLREQIKEGQKLVSTYKIDIDSWLRWFNQNREQLGNLAKSLYQSNELVSEENQIILLNFVDYLCVPASEDILTDILYYVFGLLDKEISLNKYLEEVCSKVIELMSYIEWEKEYKPAKELVDTSKFEQNAHQEKVEWQTPKPLALTGANVSPINAMIKAILVNCPSLITLRPSGDKWKISVLPVRVSNYHLAIYLSDKLGLKDLTDHLNSSMQFLAPDTDEYKQLQILKDRVLNNQVISKDEVLTSTNILKATLHKETMLSHKLSYTDHYYRPFTLGYVTRIEEIERELPSYTLTVWGNEKDTRQTDTPIVINWLKRLPYLLSNHFQAELPTFNEVRGYLQSSFKFKNVELIVKNGHTEGIGKHKRVYPGIFLEVYYQDVLQTRQLLNITTPVTDNRKGGKVPVKVSHTIDVNYPRELAKLLKCQLTDDHLIKQAMAELTKIANKFISSNYTHFLSPNKTAMTTSNREIRGFDKTSKCFSQVVKTFNKFSLPFTQESEVNKGKLLDLSTLETYDKHKIASLLESLVTGWKYWSKADDEKIELGNELFHKPDPGKLMLVVHNLLNDKPHLDSLVWGDLINTFYQISGLNVGFRTNTGVVLTPFDIYSSGIERWEHRIKVQLISIIKEGDKTRTLGIESLLQRDIYSLYSLLNRLQPGWDNNEDINKHLQALHDTLAAEGDTEAIPEIPDTVEETQNHLESSSEVLEVNPEITQPIETTGEVSQVLEVIPENVEEITDPISHSSEVIEVKEETEQKLESNKIKPYLLDGSKAVSGQLTFKGVLGTVPCIFKMSPSGRLFDIQALPIKVNQFALATYVIGHHSKILATSYIERTIAKYQSMNVNVDKLREKNELITKLETLLRNLNQGIKPDASDILDATATIEKYLDKADYKPITGDSYYRYHSLGTGQFIQVTNSERYQYLVSDYGKNFRRGTGSDVNSVINWVRNCPRNLNERFGHKAAEINEIKDYLEQSFNSRFSKNVQLAVYERGQKFLEIYHKGELEIKQLISIVSPSTAKKETNLISTDTNFKPEWGTDNEFAQFLQCSEINEVALIKATREQVSVMVKKYIRSNYQTLTGKNSVFKETKIVQLVGFNQSNARYSGVVKTFLKYIRPYLDQSAPNILKGELISLDTLRTYNEQEARILIGAMTNNWKHWKHKDAETIELGGATLKKPDPGVLMLSVTAAINQQPHHDQIIWRDLIDVFYQLSELSLGFKCPNGVILTPFNIYSNDVERWEHRIKIQLISILKDGDKTRTLGIESLLQREIEDLYSTLDRLSPTWNTNQDINKHLAELHDCLSAAKKLNP